MQRWSRGIAYNGTGWHGWQKQPQVVTVQSQLEQAVHSFLGHEVQTVCAGRTDTGVHALEQVVHLDTQLVRREVSWIRGVNSFLPSGIRVQWARPVDGQFHARFSAQRRHYVYLLRNAPHPSPFTEARSAWVFQPLKLQLMLQAAQALVGTHDFSSFRSADCQANNPVRELQELRITQQGEYFIFYFSANGFLHHMVRNLMGVLVYIGMGKRPRAEERRGVQTCALPICLCYKPHKLWWAPMIFRLSGPLIARQTIQSVNYRNYVLHNRESILSFISPPTGFCITWCEI